MFEGIKHDGKSPIVFTEGANLNEALIQFWQLWDYLVPPSGKAQTAQGEMIRIAGKVYHELKDNGGMNWDNDFRKMLKSFVKYAQLGVPLTNDAKAAKKVTGILNRCGNNGFCNDHMCDLLCYLAVDWVSQNPNVIAPLEADYSR